MQFSQVQIPLPGIVAFVRRLLPFLALGLLIGACAAGQSTSPTTTTPPATVAPPVAAPLVVERPGRYEAQVISDGRLRTAVVHVPASVRWPAPLVLVFHGFTSSPARVEELSGMTAVADREGFVVAYPEALGFLPAWTVDDELQGDGDVRFVRDLVAVLTEAVEIDPDRVFAAGMSNGGGMSARLACDAADLVAAVGPVAGAYSIGTCEPGRAVPIIAFHGTGDRIVPYDGSRFLDLPSIEAWAGDWARRNGCGSPPTASDAAVDVEMRVWPDCEVDVVLYTVDDGRHGWPGSDRAMSVLDSTTSISASQIMWEFFVEHPRG